MNNYFKEFNALHYNEEPLLIGNAWNAQSAKIFQRQNFTVIGTSSSAVAESLGYNDGQEMSFDEYSYVIRRIRAVTTAYLTVDLEGGYGDSAEEICEHIAFLVSIGVSGINIEDSLVTNGTRSIIDAAVFAEKLARICRLLNNKKIELFINVRTDTFLLNVPDALADALYRIKYYTSTGVNGLFVPCIIQLADIQKVTSACPLPVNVMCMPGLPDYLQLKQAGVKRISIGPFLNMHIYKKGEDSIQQLIAEGSFAPLFQ